MLDGLRRTFDVIIVDTPPVLAVPDALVLGRRVDGALLATRYDNSRYTLVGRANDLLISARIPVLGVVLNGMRPSGSSYQTYAYGYQSTRSSPP